MNTNPLTQNPFAAPIFGNKQLATDQSVFRANNANTTQSGFSFGPTSNIQPNLNTTNFLDGRNTTAAQNSFVAASSAIADANNENPIVKIKKIIATIDNTTDSVAIKQLNFRLNNIIKGIYNNIPEIKNNFSRIHQLSRELECIDSDKVKIEFFLKIYAETKKFLTCENKDWLTKNLFQAAVATREALAKFIATNIQCVIAQNFTNNEIAIKFLSTTNSNCYEYVLGEFSTKKSFIDSVFFDISCSYICNLWNTGNTDYKCKIKTHYNIEDFSNSKIRATITHLSNNNVSLGIDLSMQELFDNSNEKICHNIKKWFITLDKITANLQALEHNDLQMFIGLNTLSKTDQQSLLKAINNMDVFHKTLTLLLKR